MPCRCARTRRRTQSLPVLQPTHSGRLLTCPDHYLRTQPPPKSKPKTSKPKTSKPTAASDEGFQDQVHADSVGRSSLPRREIRIWTAWWVVLWGLVNIALTTFAINLAISSSRSDEGQVVSDGGVVARQERRWGPPYMSTPPPPPPSQSSEPPPSLPQPPPSQPPPPPSSPEFFQPGSNTSLHPRSKTPTNATWTVVVLTLTASGSVSDYSDNVTSSLQQKVATTAGVNKSLVTIDVAAASVRITATIAVPASPTADAVQTSLFSAFGTADAASTALGVTVEEVPIITVEVKGEDEPLH